MIIQHMYIFIIAVSATCTDTIVAKKSPGIVRTCEENEYFHIERGYCMECTRCEEGEYTWLPCSNLTNTLCGPQWSPNIDNGAQNEITPSSIPCGMCNHNAWTGDVIWLIFTVCIVISTLIVIIAIIITTHYVLKRKRDMVYRQDKSSIDPMMVCSKA